MMSSEAHWAYISSDAYMDGFTEEVECACCGVSFRYQDIAKHYDDGAICHACYRDAEEAKEEAERELTENARGQ